MTDFPSPEEQARIRTRALTSEIAVLIARHRQSPPRQRDRRLERASTIAGLLASLLSFVVAFSLAASCAPGDVTVTAGSEVLELTGVPGEEIRLRFTEPPERLSELPGQLFARLRSEDLEFDSTLPILLDDVRAPAFGRLLVPGIPGHSEVRLTGTLWGTIDARYNGPPQIEVPLVLHVIPRGAGQTSGQEHMAFSEVFRLSALLSVTAALWLIAAALGNWWPAFLEEWHLYGDLNRAVIEAMEIGKE